MKLGQQPTKLDFRDRIIIALDVKTANEALNLLASLEQQVSYVKVGMELFYGEGYQLIEKLQDHNLKIFLDLKMHDIPNTVAGATAQLTRLGVDMFNLHVAGGRRMMEAARNAMEQSVSATQNKPLLIGVTQLTSTDEQMLHQEIGIPLSIQDAVGKYAQLAKNAGLDGVVSSPLEVEKIKEICGQEFLAVTPGIRPAGGLQHDQIRVTTPKQAFAMGSDYIVIGRAVTQAENPAAAFISIVDSLLRGER